MKPRSHNKNMSHESHDVFTNRSHHPLAFCDPPKSRAQFAPRLLEVTWPNELNPKYTGSMTATWMFRWKLVNRYTPWN